MKKKKYKHWGLSKQMISLYGVCIGKLRMENSIIAYKHITS